MKATPVFSTEEKIAEMQAQIVELKDEVRRERMRKNAYDGAYDIGSQISANMQGLTDAGLPEDKAWQIIMAGITGGLKQ